MDCKLLEGGNVKQSAVPQEISLSLGTVEGEGAVLDLEEVVVRMFCVGSEGCEVPVLQGDLAAAVVPIRLTVDYDFAADSRHEGEDCIDIFWYAEPRRHHLENEAQRSFRELRPA